MHYQSGRCILTSPHKIANLCTRRMFPAYISSQLTSAYVPGRAIGSTIRGHYVTYLHFSMLIEASFCPQQKVPTFHYCHLSISHRAIVIKYHVEGYSNELSALFMIRTLGASPVSTVFSRIFTNQAGESHEQRRKWTSTESGTVGNVSVAE